MSRKTAQAEGLILCDVCQLVVKANQQGDLRCPRCESPLHSRKPNSLGRTWALVITAWILLIPANLFPIMTVVYLADGEPDTIISGVIKLAQEGMVPIAVIVFIASVAVPILKLLSIMLLLLVVQRRWNLNKRHCTWLYRVVEVIGAWSMLDLFIISILVTLVDLGAVATITAGPGATAFASVVVITMFAAMAFDPRLIWDLQEKNND